MRWPTWTTGLASLMRSSYSWMGLPRLALKGVTGRASFVLGPSGFCTTFALI